MKKEAAGLGDPRDLGFDGRNVFWEGAAGLRATAVGGAGGRPEGGTWARLPSLL